MVYVALGVVGVLLVVCLLMGVYLSNYSLNINRQTYDDAINWAKEHYDISWFDKNNEKAYVIKSFDDYEMHMYFYKNRIDTNKYIIITHGYSDNHYGNLKYMGIYLDLGYNVITYDLRGHGNNEKTYCSYSIRESKDLLNIIEDTHNRYDNIEYLGIHGESLGAATSVAVLKYKPDIDFVVADCGFARISTILKNGVESKNLPVFLYYFASFITKLRTGYFYKDMSPINGIEDNKIPILFIHGASDEFIGKSNSELMHKKNGGYSDLLIVDKAGHAGSVLTDYKLYHDTVLKFLENVE